MGRVLGIFRYHIELCAQGYGRRRKNPLALLVSLQEKHSLFFLKQGEYAERLFFGAYIPQLQHQESRLKKF